MISFGQPGYTGLPEQTHPTIFVKPVRRDGKIPCVYVFPISGKRFSKLLTFDQLTAERLTGRYHVIG